jgi:NAD(P)-dependent dehydrogenase (short-subunit alcohol dehydrogenase family)
VTGASSGLGLAICRELIRRGAGVALIARSTAVLDEEAHALGPTALPLACDVADEQSVAGAFAAIAARFGKLHGLVNCAAIGLPVSLAELPPKEFMAHFAVNVLGPALCTKAALPLMVKAGTGEILNVSSISVDDPFPMLAPYAASKAALETWSVAAQRELLDRNVRVQVLRVGSMSGGKFATGWDPDMARQAVEIARAQGRFSDRGAPMPAEDAALAAVDMLALPRSAHAELVVLKPRHVLPPASPERGE